MPRHAVITSFKPGQSGNPKGRPKRDWTWSGLLAEVGERIEPKSKKTFKELVSSRIWIKAANGDVVAIKEIFNRMDGLPTETISTGDQPFEVLHIFKPEKLKEGGNNADKKS
jgi:hypothetical protein